MPSRFSAIGVSRRQLNVPYHEQSIRCRLCVAAAQVQERASCTQHACEAPCLVNKPFQMCRAQSQHAAIQPDMLRCHRQNEKFMKYASSCSCCCCCCCCCCYCYCSESRAHFDSTNSYSRSKGPRLHIQLCGSSETKEQNRRHTDKPVTQKHGLSNVVRSLRSAANEPDMLKCHRQNDRCGFVLPLLNKHYSLFK
jgi:hypothetical protein